jgi:hypothetical protein
VFLKLVGFDQYTFKESKNPEDSKKGKDIVLKNKFRIQEIMDENLQHYTKENEKELKFFDDKQDLLNFELPDVGGERYDVKRKK